MLEAVFGVMRASDAMEQGRAAAEDARLALLAHLQARLPARGAEIESYLLEVAGPESARVQRFVEDFVAHMAQLLIESFTLEQLQGFDAFQRSARFQEMAPAFGEALQSPLLDYQAGLVRDANAHFN